MDFLPKVVDSRQTPTRVGALRGVLAFIFTPDFSKVLLILKNRPAWAAGKYNGVGGKHEQGETDQQCASREVKEEAGIEITEEAWQTVAHIEWSDWDGAVLSTIWRDNLDFVESKTDEPVSWHSTNKLPENCMPNLRWLIPLAQDVLEEMDEKTPGRERKRALYIQAKYRILLE